MSEESFYAIARSRLLKGETQISSDIVEGLLGEIVRLTEYKKWLDGLLSSQVEEGIVFLLSNIDSEEFHLRLVNDLFGGEVLKLGSTYIIPVKGEKRVFVNQGGRYTWARYDDVTPEILSRLREQ